LASNGLTETFFPDERKIADPLTVALYTRANYRISVDPDWSLSRANLLDEIDALNPFFPDEDRDRVIADVLGVFDAAGIRLPLPPMPSVTELEDPYIEREKVTIRLPATWKTLDDIRPIYWVAKILCVKETREAIAHEIVKQGLMSGIMPEGHEVLGPRRSLYLRADIVGEECYEINRHLYIKTHVSSLHNFEPTKLLAELLGTKRDRTEMAKKLVEEGFVSSNLPDFYTLSNGTKFMPYFDPYVMGSKEAADRNLGEYIRRNFKTIDNLFLHEGLRSVLGCERSVIDMARECVARGYLSPIIPHGHSISRTHGCLFLDVRVVEEEAQRNIDRYVRYTYATPEDIEEDQALAHALGVPHSRSSIRKACQSRGIWSS